MVRRLGIALLLIGVATGGRVEDIWAMGPSHTSTGDEIMQLIEQAQDDTVDLAARVAAIRRLGEAQPDRVVPLLMRLLTSMEPAVGEAAREALKRLGAPALLIHLLAGADGDARRQAAFALRFYPGSERVVESLLKATSDASSAVRWTALWSLGVLLQRGAADDRLAAVATAVEGTIDHPDPEVRFWAAWTLGELAYRVERRGSAAGIEGDRLVGLRRRLEDRARVEEDPDVRTEIDRALRHLPRR